MACCECCTKGRPLAGVFENVCQWLGHDRISPIYHVHPSKLKDFYEISTEILGSGMSGSVFLAIHRTTRRKVAVKSLVLSEGLDEEKEKGYMENELKLFLHMSHPNIARLLEVFEHRKKLHLVMEHLKGGSLGSLASAGACQEEAAAILAEQMFSAVSHMHAREIMHRDLKPANFVFEGPKSWEGRLVLIDFGLAKYCPNIKKVRGQSGTLEFMAPEVFRGAYDLKCDIWSMGVILFYLLVGNKPFEAKPATSEARGTLVRTILAGKVSVRNRERWRQLSQASRAFTMELLCPQPYKRPTAAEALQCSWLKSVYTDDVGHLQNYIQDHGIGCHLDCSKYHRIVAFVQGSLFVRACVIVLVLTNPVDIPDSSYLKQKLTVFKMLDTNQDGVLQRSELCDPRDPDIVDRRKKNGCQIGADFWKQNFKDFDINGDDAIDFVEYTMHLYILQDTVKETLLKATFSALDANSDGFISPDDLQRALGKTFYGIPTEQITSDAFPSPRKFMNYITFAELLCNNLGWERVDVNSESESEISEASDVSSG